MRPELRLLLASTLLAQAACTPFTPDEPPAPYQPTVVPTSLPEHNPQRSLLADIYSISSERLIAQALDINVEQVDQWDSARAYLHTVTNFLALQGTTLLIEWRTDTELWINGMQFDLTVPHELTLAGALLHTSLAQEHEAFVTPYTTRLPNDAQSSLDAFVHTAQFVPGNHPPFVNPESFYSLAKAAQGLRAAGFTMPTRFQLEEYRPSRYDQDRVVLVLGMNEWFYRFDPYSALAHYIGVTNPQFVIDFMDAYNKAHTYFPGQRIEKAYLVVSTRDMIDTHSSDFDIFAAVVADFLRGPDLLYRLSYLHTHNLWKEAAVLERLYQRMSIFFGGAFIGGERRELVNGKKGVLAVVGDYSPYGTYLRPDPSISFDPHRDPSVFGGDVVRVIDMRMQPIVYNNRMLLKTDWCEVEIGEVRDGEWRGSGEKGWLPLEHVVREYSQYSK